MSTAQRLQRLKASMRDRGLDALFVSQPQNVYYLTGFRCRSWNLCQPLGDPEGFVLVEPERLTFLCDDRYDPSAAKAAGADHVRITSPPGVDALARELKTLLDRRGLSLGFEPSGLLHADAVGLIAATDPLRWQPADDLLMNQRILKDRAELDLLREAARVTDAACAHVVGRLRLGMSEHDVADEIGNYLRRNSEGLAFDTIVAFDAAAAAPHYHPSRQNKTRKGSLVLMDFGGVWEGYHGDLTRCAFMGKADGRQREIYEHVLQSQQAGLAGIRPGLTEGQADAFCRDYFSRYRLADRFIHGTGHGVGLAIHEPPRLKQSLTTPLAAGMVVTVEPGLYIEGWGGIRIEDVVIVTDSGSENITHAPKQLMEIPC